MKKKQKVNITQRLTKKEQNRLRELRQKKANMEKLARKRDSTQKSIPFKRMYADGVCELEDNVYNRMVEFGDINYELLDEQEKKSLLKQYEKFINFFDTSISLQLFLFNRRKEPKTLMEQVGIAMQDDGHDDIRKEVSDMLKEQAVNGTGGVVKSKYFIFGVKEKNISEARARLTTIESESEFIRHLVTRDISRGGRILRIRFLIFNVKPYNYSDYQADSRKNKRTDPDTQKFLIHY